MVQGWPLISALMFFFFFFFFSCEITLHCLLGHRACNGSGGGSCVWTFLVLKGTERRAGFAFHPAALALFVSPSIPLPHSFSSFFLTTKTWGVTAPHYDYSSLACTRALALHF
uniref:Uncharacterized protein n=1 Tax=Trypanosoma vivax (strain Y486) TaxID=1055687 RepID=G0UAE9_TRYVY|nr:hypothetical protein TVY486_1102670 [Trypanosoma vivax Y486]